jgi:hypothetical protein
MRKKRDTTATMRKKRDTTATMRKKTRVPLKIGLKLDVI